jgi:hypothetical protein
MRPILLLGSLLSFGLFLCGMAGAQVQPEGQFLGSSFPPVGPPETRQQIRLKTTACNKAASKYKLRGSDRKTYLDRCMALTYSGKDFMPPNWPLN